MWPLCFQIHKFESTLLFSLAYLALAKNKKRTFSVSWIIILTVAYVCLPIQVLKQMGSKCDLCSTKASQEWTKALSVCLFYVYDCNKPIFMWPLLLLKVFVTINHNIVLKNKLESLLMLSLASSAQDIDKNIECLMKHYIDNGLGQLTFSTFKTSWF